MTSIENPFLCPWCKHLDREGKLINGVPMLTCAAFSEGVPGSVLTNEHDHREPLIGDSGIQFELVDDADGEPPYDEMFDAKGEVSG